MSKDPSFVETALVLSGKSEDEAERTGKLDVADEQVEALFSEKYRTVNSPIHKAVWGEGVDPLLFIPCSQEETYQTKEGMKSCLELVKTYKEDGGLLDEKRKLKPEVLKALGGHGYWGMLIHEKYGGMGCSFNSFSKFLTRMATIDPTIAGLASVHGCIGAVDPLIAFGTEAQKEKWLPLLADGKLLSGFALTEPNAGSDLTALRTTATLVGDEYLVNGEKLFITNATYGRAIGLVVLIENKPAVLFVQLPEQDTETFQLKNYGLYALKHTHNNGLVFKNFKVPAENLIEPPKGDGLTIAYHGLNRGRVALCANAAGTMRLMLANMLPWAGFRVTYGQSIDNRELVRRRVGEMAGLIVACDALSEWSAALLDHGYRGEMECIVAKIFGSEAQAHAAINLFMKTHGGRSFLHGHFLGDNIHEFLAPCIYEGEGEMLGMAFFKSLVKEHGTKYFEPVGKGLVEHGIKKFKPWNPIHLWKLRSAIWPYAKWQIKQRFSWIKSKNSVKGFPLEDHQRWATKILEKSKYEVDALMRKHELKLPDRQCAMSELSERIQIAVVVLVTAMWANNGKGALQKLAADVICRELRNKYEGKRRDGRLMKDMASLGKLIVEGGSNSPFVAGINADEILMSYEK